MSNFEYNFRNKLAVESEKIFEEHWNKVCVPAIKKAIDTNPEAIFAVYEMEHSAAMRAIYTLLPPGVIPRSTLHCFRSATEYLEAKRELTTYFVNALDNTIVYYDIRLCVSETSAQKTLDDIIEKIRKNNKGRFYANARNLVEQLYRKRH